MDKPSEARSVRRLAAILAADVVGYSRMMGVDEEGTLRAVMAARRDVIDPEISRHGGRIFKTMGDGLLVEFPSAVDSVRCAVAIQGAMAEAQTAREPDRRLVLRIGINAGDVLGEGEDLFGDGVNIAARLESEAGPGQILVGATVADAVRGKLPIGLDDLGKRELKNIAHPVALFRVNPGGRGPAATGARPRRANTPLLAAGIAAALALATGIGWYVVSGGFRDKPPVAATNEDGRRLSVAVMPFVNLSGDPGQEAYVDGLTEDIVNDLSRIAGAFVTSRNTTFAFKGRNVEARNVGAELGVRYVLEGSVRPGTDRVRVNAQLVEARTGTQIWSDRFEFDPRDSYTLQDKVIGRIARALSLELREAESQRAQRGRPENADAADLAVQGWVILFNRPQTRETNEQARPLLERAVKLDPNNADAWTALAYMHSRAARFGWSASREDSIRLAREAGERAVFLAPRSADAVYMLAFATARGGDWERARSLIDRCLDLNPNFATGYTMFGNLKLLDGQPNEALAAIDKAFRLSPRDGLAALWHAIVGTAQIMLNDDVKGEKAARSGIVANPQQPNSYIVLAAALGNQGKVEEAKAALDDFMRLKSDRSIGDWIASEAIPRETALKVYARFFDGLRRAGFPD